MDPLTHLLFTRKLLGTDRVVVIAGLAPDLAFYLTYPPWLIIKGEFIGALRTNDGHALGVEQEGLFTALVSEWLDRVEEYAG
jgi:hypothetical protein